MRGLRWGNKRRLCCFPLQAPSLCNGRPIKNVLCALSMSKEEKEPSHAKGGLLFDAGLWEAWQLLLASCPVGSGLWAGETAALASRACITVSCLI